MRILVVSAPVGALGAGTITRAVAAGWRAAAPDDVVVPHTLATGEAGLAEVVGPGVAVIEAAAHLEQDGSGGTARLGREVLEAVDTGAARIVIGAGLSRVHDGGRGFAEVVTARWGSLAAAREALACVDLVLAGSDPSPLLGLHGAGARLAAEIGPAAAQEREREVAAFAAGVEADLAPADLVTGRRIRWSSAPFSGLAGGAGFLLLALGARAVGGEEYSAACTGLTGAVADADLCVVVVEEVDDVALHRSALTAVAPAALAAAVPVVVVSAADHTSRRHRAGLGVVGSHTCAIEEDALVGMGRRLARTWSPRRA